jgi:hypothetical protein
MIECPLDLGCTLHRARILGIDAVVNARGGQRNLNDMSIEEIELRRDAWKIRDWLSGRVRFYQFNSKFFRRNLARVGHLLSTRED